MSTPTRGITNLPPELLLVIFELAHSQAAFDLLARWPQSAPQSLVYDYRAFLYSLCGVCRLWEDIAHRCSALWTILPIVDGPGCHLPISDFLRRSSTKPLTLLVNCWTKALADALDQLASANALRRVHSLDVAVLRSSGSIAFSLGCCHFPALQHLRITGGLVPGPPDWDWLALHGMTLRSLSLAHCAPPFGPPPPTLLLKLERLMLRGLEGHYLPFVTASVPNLRELHILHKGPTSDKWKSLMPPSDAKRKLSTLVVEGKVDRALIVHLVTEAPQLQKVTIDGSEFHAKALKTEGRRRESTAERAVVGDFPAIPAESENVRGTTVAPSTVQSIQIVA